jgi:hypothetical protein
MGWIIPRSGHVFQTTRASSGVRAISKTCRHPYPKFGPRAKTPPVLHRMNRPSHRMSQNGVDHTQKRARFPNDARVVRGARRFENVPTSLSEVRTPGQNTAGPSSDESAESSDEPKWGGSYPEAGTFSKRRARRPVYATLRKRASILIQSLDASEKYTVCSSRAKTLRTTTDRPCPSR